MPYNVETIIKHLSDFQTILLFIILLLVIAYVFIIGIPFRIKGESHYMGGLKNIFKNRDEDVALKEALKKQIDEIDNSMESNLYDLIDSKGLEFEKLLIEKHCSFTLDKFIWILKEVLIRGVRRNNLKEKLCESSKVTYINKIIVDVSSRYENLRAKAKLAKCEDQYEDFCIIEKNVRTILEEIFDSMKEEVLTAINKKIALYEETEKQFNVKEIAWQACQIPTEKNKKYKSNLEKA